MAINFSIAIFFHPSLTLRFQIKTYSTKNNIFATSFIGEVLPKKGYG